MEHSDPSRGDLALDPKKSLLSDFGDHLLVESCDVIDFGGENDCTRSVFGVFLELQSDFFQGNLVVFLSIEEKIWLDGGDLDQGR